MTRMTLLMLAILCAGLSATSCGEDGEADSGCTAGRVESCPCGGGEPDGTQTCQEDGTWGECDCGSTDSDSDSDSDTDTDIDTESCDQGTWSGDHSIGSIEDVAEIAGYTEITGSLTIDDSILDSLDGLQCLASVGQNLNIRSNGDLFTLAGLDGLTTVGERVHIYDNQALTTDLEGLGSLVTIGLYLDIEDNDTLTELDGLSSLETVGENIMVVGNAVLPDCEICELQEQLTDSPSADASENLDDACTPIEDFCEGFMDPCPDYTGDDECCLNNNPCDWGSNDVCDCDATCAWDATDCEG